MPNLLRFGSQRERQEQAFACLQRGVDCYAIRCEALSIARQNGMGDWTITLQDHELLAGGCIHETKEIFLVPRFMTDVAEARDPR